MEAKSSGRTWVLVSTLGLAIGIPGGLALGAPLEVLVGAMLVTPLMLGLAGLFLGTSQWIVLRQRISAPRWIGLTVLGFAVGFTVALVLVEKGGEALTGAPVRMSSSGTVALVVSLIVLGLVGGSVVGLAQSLALRHVSGALRSWVASTALGLTLGFLLGLTAANVVGGMTSGPGLGLFLIISGLVYAATTKRALRRILPAV